MQQTHNSNQSDTHPSAARQVDEPVKGGGSRDVEKAEEIGKFPVIKRGRWYLTLSALVAIVGAVMGGAYQFVRLVQIQPLEQSVEESRRSLSTSETDRQSIRSQLTFERTKYAELLTQFHRPVLLSPPDGASLIGTQQLFSWDYSKHDANTSYILELRRIGNGTKEGARVLGVPQSETRRLFVSLMGESKSEFHWRIRPGAVVNGSAVPAGPWSSTGTFSIFPTVLDRIKDSGVVRLASTPTSYDRAVASDGSGGFSGYEYEVAKWLVQHISATLGVQTSLKLELVDVSWDRLFSAVQRGEADMAIRSITRSATREREFPNLRFTKGYLRNHQILIQTSNSGEFPKSLSGAVVGVKRNSINEKAAEFLSPKFRFKVDSSFTAYADVYQALKDGRIGFALVDSVLVAHQLGREYFQLGPRLDEALKMFYQKELGADFEEYGILVLGTAGNDKFRKVLDAAIEDAKFVAFSAELKKKYGF